MIRNDDDLVHALAGLPATTPDPAWESRLRARCHRELTRNPGRRQRTHNISRLGARLFDVTAAVAACLYLIVVLHLAARLGSGSG